MQACEIPYKGNQKKGAMKISLLVSIWMILCVSVASLFAQDKQARPAEWEEVVEAAQKEGKVVVSIPSSADLRTNLERTFRQRFGIQIESVVARGSASVRKIAEEARAGVRYFDVHMGGSESVVSGLLPEGVLAPVADSFLLSEVKDPKHWWGGHIWSDNAKR